MDYEHWEEFETVVESLFRSLTSMTSAGIKEEQAADLL